jgi:two-component system sensor histidine kinase BaeS
MLVRELERPLSVNRKEMMFKERGKTFLLISFAIAGGGAVLLSIFFTLFLSKPLKKMKGAVQAMANRDFSVRMPVMSRDEIGSLSESFNFMAEALEREEALRKHLTSNIAHELRTPLSIMKANVEAMLDGVIEDNVRGLKNVQAELEKLIRLVQGIEDITKAEASFFARKEYVAVALRDFVTAIGEKMMPLAKVKGLEIQIKDAGDVSVHTDTDKLERILQNILQTRSRIRGRGTIDYGTKMKCSLSRQRHAPHRAARAELIFAADTALNWRIGPGLTAVKELLDVMTPYRSRKQAG